MLSTIVREAFPNSESCKQQVSRNKFVFGIEAMDVGPSASPDTDIPLQQQVDTLQRELNDRDVYFLSFEHSELDGKYAL